MGHHDRGAAGQHPAQHLAQRGLDRDVERGHRLVEQQHARLGGQRPGDGDPLGLAARDLRRSPARQLADADLVEPALGVRARRPPGGTPAARPEGDVLERVEVREQEGVLAEERRTTGVRRDHPAGPPGADVGEHLVVDDDPADARPHQAGQHAEHRGLARPVGAEQGEGLALGDAKLDLDVPLGDGELELSTPVTAHPVPGGRGR